MGASLVFTIVNFGRSSSFQDAGDPLKFIVLKSTRLAECFLRFLQLLSIHVEGLKVDEADVGESTFGESFIEATTPSNRVGLLGKGWKVEGYDIPTMRERKERCCSAHEARKMRTTDLSLRLLSKFRLPTSTVTSFSFRFFPLRHARCLVLESLLKLKRTSPPRRRLRRMK